MASAAGRPGLPAAEAAAPVREAATLILARRSASGPQVLMGQRGSTAAFMPDKFVFPGGAVDADDFALEGDVPPDAATLGLLAEAAAPGLGRALARAAVRELWEETGLMLGRPDPTAAGREVPAGWAGFHAAGLVPDGAALRLVFRAVTPPGRPRRFDARFFLADAASVAGRDDDFALAGEELANLRWIDLAAARSLPLPFITEVVLAELGPIMADPGAARPVPFFDQTAAGPAFRLLGT
jgi:8-oxo-dGTP pyrophosphatase MutT (NUDIX family)